MKHKLLFILITVIFLLFRICVNAQTSSHSDRNIETELAMMDSIVFANVYTCNSAKNETFFTDDIEFYHDKGGFTKTRRTLVDELRKNFCGEGKTKLRRELIAGSMQVYPIQNYGAVQVGDHRFYITQGGREILSGVAKFIHVWKYENGEWRISRVLSYDHSAPDAKTSAIPPELYRTIALKDSQLFAGYNAHDIDGLKNFFARDVEFYRDESGLSNYNQTIENLKKMFDQNNAVKRELISNSLEVYPINNYGAIEISENRFCQEGNADNNCGTVSIIMLWQNQDSNWKVTRVISYNH